MNFVTLLFMQVAMACFVVAATNITTDQTALVALKAQLTSADPTNILAKNWSIHAPVCGWIGVVCGKNNHRVTGLNLSHMGLTGIIPSQIGNLEFLSFLSIRSNELYGPIPNELACLRRLKLLDFGYNFLNGTIPSSMWNMSWLLRVDVSHNQLSGSIPSSFYNVSLLRVIDVSFNSLSGVLPAGIFHKFPNLREINLSGNQFHGEIPSSIFKCKALRVLALSDNKFTGGLATEIQNLTILEKLHLNANNFNGRVPGTIGNCTLLKEIDLSENNLTGGMPVEVGDLYKLEILRVHGNALSGKISSSQFNGSTMRVLVMSANRFSGSLPSTLGMFLPNLAELRLGDNQLEGTISSSICNASKLAFIDLSNNSFTGFVPSTVGNLRYLQVFYVAYNKLTTEASRTSESSFLSSLSNCKQLRKVNLSGNKLGATLLTSVGNLTTSLEQFLADSCNIEGSIGNEIGNLTSLIAFSLQHNELTGDLPTTIGQLRRLQGLHLQGNNFLGNIPGDLCCLGSLVDLHFGDNKLVGSLPVCIGNLTSLGHLNLSSNRLSSVIPMSLWNLKDVLSVDVSSNTLYGNLPSDINDLTAVVMIDLSSNNLSGEIPSSIGELKHLAYLSLSNNGFQGPIPPLLGSSISLEFLDLSRNKLSGHIPKSLESLRYLEFFNVSFNELQGEIPSEGHFRSFSAQSYMNNEALCGAPRLQIPQCKTGYLQKLILLAVVLPILGLVLLVYYASIWLKFVNKKKLNVRELQYRELNRRMDELCGNILDRRYSYLELKQATDGFSEAHLLGAGSFGKVYKALLKNGLVVAIKVFNMEEETSWRSFDVERAVLFHYVHAHIIRILCCCNSPNFKAIVMEYMVNGTLDKWLHTHNYNLDVLPRVNIMMDTAMAIKYLHESVSAVIHRDLNPRNILLDEDLSARIIEFGTAKILQPHESCEVQSTFICTFGYAAPEYGFSSTVSRKVDVYSFGILLMETFTGKRPTHEMFGAEMNLRTWVIESLLANESERVIDTSLLRGQADQIAAKIECLTLILRLATYCSAGSPIQRPNMEEVVAELNLIKEEFFKNISG